MRWVAMGLTGFYIYSRKEMARDATATQPPHRNLRTTRGEPDMHRLDGGRQLREAIEAAGLSIPKLSARTKEIDPEGKGLSSAFIGFYTSTGASAREDISDRAARLMAAGVDQPVEALFGGDG